MNGLVTSRSTTQLLCKAPVHLNGSEAIKEKIINYNILVFQETKLDDLDKDYVKQYFSSLGFDCH